MRPGLDDRCGVGVGVNQGFWEELREGSLVAVVGVVVADEDDIGFAGVCHLI